MDKKVILNELEEKFEEVKKSLGFKVTFEDIEEIFFIKDAVLKNGYVSECFERQLCSRICELFLSWEQYIHSLVMPNPQNLINLNESKMFDEQDKKDFLKLMSRAMIMIDRNNLNSLVKDKKEDARFVDDSMKFWNEDFKPALIKINKKVLEGWEKKE